MQNTGPNVGTLAAYWHERGRWQQRCTTRHCPAVQPPRATRNTTTPYHAAWLHTHTYLRQAYSAPRQPTMAALASAAALTGDRMMLLLGVPGLAAVSAGAQPQAPHRCTATTQHTSAVAQHTAAHSSPSHQPHAKPTNPQELLPPCTTAMKLHWRGDARPTIAHTSMNGADVSNHSINCTSPPPPPATLRCSCSRAKPTNPPAPKSP
jgi:hypothetical protein